MENTPAIKPEGVSRVLKLLFVGFCIGAMVFLVSRWDPRPTPHTPMVEMACSAVMEIPQRLDHHGSNGGFSVSVNTTRADCLRTWTAISNTSWIDITAGSSGDGNGSVNYTVEPNLGPTRRTGTITIAGKIVTIVQRGH